MDYQAFLQQKIVTAPPCGFDADGLNDRLFEFQQDIVRWSLRRGRAAIFADCGLGKTPMQLEWAHHVSLQSQAPVLILAPLAVAQQTRREGEKFGIGVTICRSQDDVQPGVNVANYEMLPHFTADAFAGIVLDESGILKAYDGKTRTAIIDSFRDTPYRLACTATPAPNDFMELGNHSEFFNVMTRAEMLAMFFVHDGGSTQDWRLKGHAETEFWRWVASWGCLLRKPSDLGYPDDGFALPQLQYVPHVVEGRTPEGRLFPVDALSLMDRREARRASLHERVEETAGLVNNSTAPWIVWCDLNAESEALVKAIPDAVEVTGSDHHEIKEQRLLDFAAGNIRVMVTKPSIAGFGLNFQHCADMAFCGLSDSYEQLYQAVRRCWRFGQKRPVNVHIITSENEGAVVSNIQRKDADAETMYNGMVEHTAAFVCENMQTGTERYSAEYREDIATGKRWTIHLGDCVEGVRSLPDNSVDYSIFSPPFASLYTYSNSDRDMGNSKDEASFMAHFRYLVDDLYRVLKPGRLLSFHCMNLPTSKCRDGYIGISDFRGKLIELFTGAEGKRMHDAYNGIMTRADMADIDGDAARAERLREAARIILHELSEYPGPQGFIYHSEVCIWKDPVTAMQRTKAIGLLYKQLKKDSALSRQGIPDYLVTMRKPGVNPDPVTKDPEGFPVGLWQRYASPVWMDINPSDTLQASSAREERDERHICPLQLEVIRRAVQLWTNPGDIVLSPFAGIGSEGVVSLELGRRFVGYELKPSYWRQAVANLRIAEQRAGAPTLFDSYEEDPNA